MFLRVWLLYHSQGCSRTPRAGSDPAGEDPRFARSTAAQEPIWRTLRVAQNRAIQARMVTLESTMTLAKIPSVTVNDCQNTTSLPGKPVAKARQFQRPDGQARFRQDHGGRRLLQDLFRPQLDRRSRHDAGVVHPLRRRTTTTPSGMAST